MKMNWTSKTSAAMCGALLLSSMPVAAIAQTQSARAAAAKAEATSGTARLNAEQAAKAWLEQEAYEARVRAGEEANARAQAEFANRTAVYEARKERVSDRAADQRLQWEADVIACEAGDATRCAPEGSVPPTH